MNQGRVLVSPPASFQGEVVEASHEGHRERCDPGTLSNARAVLSSRSITQYIYKPLSSPTVIARQKSDYSTLSLAPLHLR
jgi:hypothetical protein